MKAANEGERCLEIGLDPAKPVFGAAWQSALHGVLGELMPGLFLAGTLAWAGAISADWIGRVGLSWISARVGDVLGVSWSVRFDKSPISGIMMTILLGLLVRNVAGLPRVYEAGLRFCVQRVLRVGIALLGLGLSLWAVGQIGTRALPIITACIASALVLVTWLGRAMRLPIRLGMLIAVGTSICGTSAIVATGPVIDAEEDEVSYAVACITLFGVVAMFAYPLLATWSFSDTSQAGLFLGTAIHETAQVAGAGLMYEQFYEVPEVLRIAATTKLVRNVCMGLVIPLVVVVYRRRMHDREPGNASLKWHDYLPVFVVAFVALAAVRTIGDAGSSAFGLLPRATWNELLDAGRGASVACLTVAMAGVGLGTSLTQLKRLGWKPLGVGLAAALLVGVVSLTLVTMLASPA